jgi:hypothetical protein
MTNKLMGISKNKIRAIAIAIFFMFSMTASMMLVPTTSAHSPAWKIPTYAYINVSPNPVGTGQSVEVIMWLNLVIDGAAIPNDVRWHNYSLTITAPDGTKTTTSWAVVQDSTGNQDYFFTPTQVGTYTFTFTFPGQQYTYTEPVLSFIYFTYGESPYYGDTYEASTASTNLTVQSSPVAAIPATPLPTAYWTRPIYGENSNWYTISSNWLGDGAPGYYGFANTYNLGGNGEQLAGAGDLVGSLTSHVMWTKPLQMGGIVGGNQTAIQGDSFFEGSAYNQRYTNPIIVGGFLYYTEPISFAGVPGSMTGSAYGPTDCVNLQTGQLVWSRSDVPALSFAYIYDVQDSNQHGVYPPILFTSNWEAFDAYTGDPMFTVTNVPSGTTILGSNGEHLIISMVNYGPVNEYGAPTGPPKYYLQEWNSSRLWTGQYNGESTSPAVVPPYLNGANPVMLDWNVSVPYLNTAGSTTEVGAINNDLLLCYNGSLPAIGAVFMGLPSWTPYEYFAVNIDQSSGSLGSILWHQTYNPPAGNITVLEAGIDPVNRVFVENYRETAQYVGYSLDTGLKLWGPTTPQAYLDYYGSPASGSLANAFAYGKMYSSAYAGIVYCYDTKTGDLLWTYGNGGEGNSTNSGVETPFSHYPTFVNAIGNGVVYTVTTEHTPETPLFKGGLARAINATTGAEIWTISEYTGEFESFSYAMADGYNTWFNGYDNQIYVVGRGPSATTVTAPNIGVTTATPITITGTVMDVSTGTQQTEQKGDFPNGVPVASDASMTQWMGYVYQQQPEPTNFKGVPVQIAVLDSNGNHYPIGTATTDEYGTYSLTWTPIISGNYTVYATFAGTNGYWPSSADTHIYASAPPATPAPTATPITGLATMSALTYGIVAVIIVIIIAIAIVGLLILRKHA